MLHPELINQHDEDCKAIAEVKKGTITNPWGHTPTMINGEFIYHCTGCSAKMLVKVAEVANYADAYVNGIFE